jgi:protoporphyrinogen oxidase
MTLYVLGGGAAGLAVVDGLVDGGAGRFVLIERAPRLGGLAQTLNWPGVGKHDLGPHKIFTLDGALLRRVTALLPDGAWLTHEKRSSVYVGGRHLPYPPSPFALAAAFGAAGFAQMVAGFAAARVKALGQRFTPRSFEEDLIDRLGRPLYWSLFRPIALKLWGDPAALDVKLSQGRVQTPSLIEICARLLGIKWSRSFEALSFHYPRGGLGRVWEAIEAKTAGHGEFLLGHAVTGFEIDGDRIGALRLEAVPGACATRLRLGKGDFVASTLPLAQSVGLLAAALPPDLPTLVEEIVALNDLLLVFLHIDRTSLIGRSWVFAPGLDIASHRVSEQGSFDPDMTPRGAIVCCEMMSSSGRPLAARSDAELAATAVADLRAMGYGDFQVLDTRIIRLPRSYPVYRIGYGAGLARITAALDGIRNFRSIGRQGSFNYIGTLDAMDIGYGFARWYMAPGRPGWESERSRTSHYPVLD